MYYLIAIPIILLAVLISKVAAQAKIKSIQFICKIIIIVALVFFVYSYAAYNGYDIIKMIVDYCRNLLPQ